MAVTYFGVNIGGDRAPDVTISASTTSSDIELAVSDANLPAAQANARFKIQEALRALTTAVNEYDY